MRVSFPGPGPLLALGGAALLVLACSDGPTAVRDDATAAPAVSARTIAPEIRAQLGATLSFARAHLIPALPAQDGAQPVVSAFASLAVRIDAGDGAGAERSLDAAREAVRVYRAGLASDAAELADLDALSLTLERASMLLEEDATLLTPTQESSR